MSSVEGPSAYLDADAGSLDSAVRRVALAEDERVPLPARMRILADVGRFVDDFVQLTGARGDEVRKRMLRLLARQSAALSQARTGPTPSGAAWWGCGRTVPSRW